MNGVPTVIIDGQYVEVGGGDGCTAAYNLYHDDYDRRMTETGGTSPVDITGYIAAGPSSCSLQATFHLLNDPPRQPGVWPSLSKPLLAGWASARPRFPWR